MDIKNLYYTFLEKDINGREINIFKFNSIKFAEIFYPNCLIYSFTDKTFYNPIEETVMSLKGIENNNNNKINFNYDKIVEEPLFYFIYNTDNYFHFLYDTIPYLISYLDLKKRLNIKLLMNYPNYQSNNFYPFVIEFLNLLDINEQDILLVDKNTLYKEIYISSSYTHGHDSNLPPREEIYQFYKEIVFKAIDKFDSNYKTHKKIYISRRTWLHNNLSNIGTNYTTRRKLENEDELVNFLISKGFVEVFTENLSTLEKIHLFLNVEEVVGAIGGGLCNVLFSNPNTKLTCIVSPTFLEVNNRFLFALNKINTNYVYDTEHVDKNEWKKYIRVKIGNIIGEIEEIYNDSLLISYVDKTVAGWNSKMNMKKGIFPKNKCLRLDNGLNSPWILNINSIDL